MGDQVLYAAIVRSSDRETLIQGSPCSPGNGYDKGFLKLKERMVDAGLQPNERKRIMTADNTTWVCECDGNKILYLILVAEKYSERLAYQFINDLRKGFAENANYYNLTPAEASRNFGAQFEQLSKKYNDPGSVDKISSVSNKIDEASKKAEASLRKALTNQQDLQNTNEKSENARNLANNYSDNADELRKIMYWRNMKLKVILSMMGVAALFSVAIPVVSKFSSG